MEERRKLFYISEEDIPSSATPVTADTTTPLQGNVLYVPIEFSTKPRSSTHYADDYMITVSSASDCGIEYNDILYRDILLSYGGNTLHLNNDSCCLIYLYNSVTISGTSYNTFYYLTPLIEKEIDSSADTDTYYTYLNRVRDGQTVYSGTTETSNNSGYTSNCVLLGYVKIRFVLYGALQSNRTMSISKYLSFTIKGSGAYYTNFENPVYVDTE